MHRAPRTAAELHNTSPPMDAGGLMGVLAHELRTPMTTIYAGSAVLAHDERLLPAVRREVAADIYAEAARLFRAVEDLLVMTRIEYHALELTREPVSMPRVIDAVIALEGPRWPRLSMMVDAPGSLPLVEADPSAVAHALRNLVANIGWRAHTGASLHVHAEQREPERSDAARVVCVLSDETGTLGPSDIDVLFELPGGDSFPGIASYGIGMFVAARLIEAMDGRLEASMRDDGVVSIRFDLPVYPAGASAA